MLPGQVEIKMEKEDKGIHWEVLDLDTKAKYAKNGEEVRTFWRIPESEDTEDIDYGVWEKLTIDGRSRDDDKIRAASHSSNRAQQDNEFAYYLGNKYSSKQNQP